MNIFTSNVYLLRSNLFFCAECLSNSYHSIFHQLIVVEYCPFHPESQLTDLCPSCGETFRYYNFGAYENAFCCKNCDFAINNTPFFNQIQKWSIEPKLITPINKFLDKQDFKYNRLYFIFANEIGRSDSNYSCSNIIKLLNMDFNALKSPFALDKYSEFQLQYLNSPVIRKSYKFKAILPSHLRFVPHYINKYLDVALFNQSKAILKTVERFILKDFDKKTISLMKRSYNSKGYIGGELVSFPFIEWKNECYGDWIFDIENKYPKEFDPRNRYSLTEKQIFPNVRYFYSFMNDFMDLIENIQSFSLIENIFNKLLFIYLYNRYLEIKNIYSNSKIELIPFKALIIYEGKYKFI